MLKILMLCVCIFFAGCTIHVSDPDFDEYCYADYYCEWHDSRGYYHDGFFCYEEITSYMRCR